MCIRDRLDVGGGSGAFAKELVNKHPSVKISVFDIPGSSADSEPHKFIPGSFFTDQIPAGFDTVSCVRVLYDHDDKTVSDLLLKIHSSLPTGGRIVVSEPMLGELSPNKWGCLLYTSPSPRDGLLSRMPSSA